MAQLAPLPPPIQSGLKIGFRLLDPVDTTNDIVEGLRFTYSMYRTKERTVKFAEEEDRSFEEKVSGTL